MATETSPMKCPRCSGDMKRGYAAVQDSVPAFLLGGLSWMSLWWCDTSRSKASRVKVIARNGERWADRCPRCETVVVYSNKESSAFSAG